MLEINEKKKEKQNLWAKIVFGLLPNYIVRRKKKYIYIYIFFFFFFFFFVLQYSFCIAENEACRRLGCIARQSGRVDVEGKLYRNTVKWVSVVSQYSRCIVTVG